MTSNKCKDLCEEKLCIEYTSITGEIINQCIDNEDNSIILIIISVISVLILSTGVVIAIIKFRKRKKVFSTIVNKADFIKHSIGNECFDKKEIVSEENNLNDLQGNIILSPDLGDRKNVEYKDKVNKPEDIIKNLIKFDIRQSRSVSENLINEQILKESVRDENQNSKIYLGASPGIVSSPFRKKRSKFTYSEIKQRKTSDDVMYFNLNTKSSNNQNMV